MAAADPAFPNGSDGESPFVCLSLSLSLNLKKGDIDFGRTLIRRSACGPPSSSFFSFFSLEESNKLEVDDSCAFQREREAGRKENDDWSPLIHGA